MFFFFNDTATTEIYTLSLHDALPIYYLPISTSETALTRLLASTKLPSGVTSVLRTILPPPGITQVWNFSVAGSKRTTVRSEEHTSELQSRLHLVCRLLLEKKNHGACA